MNRFISAVAGLACAAFASSSFAIEHATREQAEALVKNAIAYYKEKGPQAAFAELSKEQGLFSHGEQYVNVYDLHGRCLAHINHKTIGRDMIELRDPDGKHFIRERIERAEKEGSGWQDYKFYDPATHKVEPKHVYFEKVGDVVFSSGAYERGQL